MKYFWQWLALQVLLTAIILAFTIVIVFTSPEITGFEKIASVLLTGIFVGVMSLARLVLAGFDQLFEEFSKPEVRFVTIHNKEKK